MKSKIIAGVSLVCVLALNLYFRTFPVYFPQLKAQARSIVLRTGEQFTAQEVYKKFPQFYPSAKDKIIKDRLAEYKRQGKKVIAQQTEDIYRKMKDKYQDDAGQTYLFELDCWHWARYVDNVVRFGRPGDETIYGKQWDLYMFAPNGFYMIWDQFLFYFSAFLYKVFCIFNPVALFTFLFYLPLFFAALFVVALFYFSYRYAGLLGAIISTLFVGLAPIFLFRSCAGWFDRDILNLLLPLLAMWAYIRSTEVQPWKQRALWICLSAFWVGLFCFTWTFWWFIFFIILAYEALFLGYMGWAYVYKKRKEPRLVLEHLAASSAFVVLSLVWILILAGPQPLSFLYQQIRIALILNKPLMASIWPNVLSTVGELRALTFNEISNSSGGRLIFGASLVSIVALVVRAFRDKTYPQFRRAAVIMLSVWFLVMTYASMRGVRFMVFLLVPLGIALGWVMHDAWGYVTQKKDKVGMAVVGILIVIFCSFSVNRANKAAAGMFPLIDDTWYKVLNIIREKSPEQTIINSWWDFGDWFKVIAKRRVIFDGQSQDSPQAYWMAKALLADDERKSLRILRMLNNGGNKAFEILNEYVRDPLQAVLLLEKLLMSQPEDVQKTLLELMPVPAAEQLLGILFGTPSRAEFIVEYTMLPKMGAISYLGDWDFSKVYIAQNLNRQEKNQIIEHLEKLGRDSQSVQTFYQEAFLTSNQNLDDWLSRRLNFYSPLYNGIESNGVVSFENGYVYNLADTTFKANNGPTPRSIFVLKDSNFMEVHTQNPTAPFSVLIVKMGDNYKCILLDRELATSLFVRLYFYNGLGMRHFIPFIDTEEGDRYIRVFNIAW